MTKKWKYNNIEGKYKTRGEAVMHPESHASVGTIFAGSAEIVTNIVADIAEGSDEMSDILEEIQ